MTLSEALQSGDPIRRPILKHMGNSGTGYLSPEYVFDLLIHGQIREMRPIIIDKDDILAIDWEVQNKKNQD